MKATILKFLTDGALGQEGYLVVLITSDPWHKRSDTTRVLEMLGTTCTVTNFKLAEKTPSYLKLDLCDPHIRVEVWSENPRQI